MRTAVISLLTMLLLTFSAYSQSERSIKVDGDGDFHLGTQTVIAGHLLEPGIYRIHLVSINGRELVTIDRVAMNRFGKGMWPSVRSEMFRVEVERVPAGSSPDRTILRVMRDDTKKRQIAIELYFRGESSRYRFPGDPGCSCE